MQPGQSKKASIFDYINVFLMAIVMISILYPFWNQIVLSFSSSSATTGLGIDLWPKEFSLEAYKYIFNYGNLGRVYFNTILRTVLGTIAIVSVTVLAAYPLSRDDLPFRGFFMGMFIVSMFVSGGMIPGYILIKELHLLNNFWVYILPGLVSAFNMIVIRTYINGLPDSLIESAKIDGAGEFRIFIQIVLPLCKPVLATVALFIAVGQWNS